MFLLSTRRSAIILWTVASTILIEALTIYLRFGRGVNATEFNKTAPLLLQIHHMFYSIPLLLVVPFLWRKPRFSSALLGTALGLILSDLSHHFLVLPLTVGNTGWHWP
jgi:hypothetical protein